MIKRYLVFACSSYYPEGGWRDFRESFDTFEEAENKLMSILTQPHGDDWGEVVDLQDGDSWYMNRKDVEK